MTAVNPASVADLEARSFRTLTDAEKSAAGALIDDAWFMLIGYRPIIATKLDPELGDVDPAFQHNVKRLIVAIVKRVVDNPEGILEEEGDDYRYRKDSVVSTGRLYVSKEEIDTLLPASGSENAFTIKPGGHRTRQDGTFIGALDSFAVPPTDSDLWGPLV